MRLPRATAVAIPHGEQRLIALPRSWLLIVCFGIINSGYGIVVAWLAPAYMAQGWSAAQAGELVAWLALAQTASGLGLPLLAAQSGSATVDGPCHRHAAGGICRSLAGATGGPRYLVHAVRRRSWRQLFPHHGDCARSPEVLQWC